MMQNKIVICIVFALIIFTVESVFSQVDKSQSIGDDQKSQQKETDTELQKELQWLQAEAVLIEVVTASKKTQKIWESPSTITIITAEDIRAYGYRTLWDALKTVVGSIPANDGFRILLVHAAF